ncbi:hypothetical protein N7457_007345 [Penicillium paradoxum]|uniref:uncharacterized protein n=1 Tax=Penicillium paradoxum TaxID=176176 RepID=UPI00254856CF|nr:uncharacterized protein N7457_007345 [Penicillium paradoxum]KAJ5779625.1 hypothetical protein N7457_007345 [Penicillium paradoxum]
MATPGRPQFFCTRPDGTLTPLVAVDEFPAGVSVRGVSRVLNASETQGMTSCGLAAPRPDPWAIDGVVYSSPRGAGSENLSEIRNFLLQVLGNGNVPENIRMSASLILFNGIDRHGALVGEGTATGSRMSPLAPAFCTGPQAASKNASLSKKEYCSYWIRHGECDYAQQGCLYKHEMPLDLASLERLGLRDIPRWFREKHNLPSLAYSGRGLGDARQPLSIQDRPPMAALPASESSANGNGKFLKSPPRGPANRGTNNGAGHNQYRGAHRNGTGTWKTIHRNGRNRAMSVTRQSACSEQSGGQSSNVETTPPSNELGFHEWCTTAPSASSSPAQPIGHSPASVSRVSPVLPNVVASKSLLDDGNSRARVLGLKLAELTEYNKDVFEAVPGISLDVPPRPNLTGRLYEHSSNPSSEGGVMLPKDLNLDWRPSTTSFPYADVAAGKVSASSASSTAAQSTGGSSTPRLAELATADTGLLHSDDICVTWGPIGGPIYKQMTPPANFNAPAFRPNWKRPGTH